MNPPFNREQFLEVFRAYNEAVFPAQYFLYLIYQDIGLLVSAVIAWAFFLLGKGR
ncbi:MAG: hypothetical protein KDD01_05260 [Phaeodactylibacter sp.]|nr:hypothetical protein [Phaeodactylibacter sp.]